MPLPKVTITVVQEPSLALKDEHIYRVVRLQNDIEPAIGSYLDAAQVKDLIRRNVTVNVTKRD